MSRSGGAARAENSSVSRAFVSTPNRIRTGDLLRERSARGPVNPDQITKTPEILGSEAGIWVVAGDFSASCASITLPSQRLRRTGWRRLPHCLS